MTSVSPRDASASILELRRLLFESELQSLQNVEQAVADPTARRQRIEQDLSKLLNSLSPAELRDLANDLKPVTQQTLSLVARDAPEELGRILAPALGPFIRSYVRVLVSGTVEGLAKLLEGALTLKALRWRWESWTTGRPIGEVALYHSLLYRVKRVLLIHEPTGMLLCAASTEDDTIDDDLVSGMLSAFRSFMQSSMKDVDTSASNLIRSGSHAFVVQQSGDVLLGAQIDGVVRPRLTEQLTEALEYIDRRFGDEVALFKGNTEPFEAARPKLEDCLVFESRESKGQGWTHVLAAGLLGLVTLALVVGIGVRVYRGVVLNAYVAALQETPGLVVTSQATNWFQAEIGGMRDPMAASPTEVWRDSGAEARWLGPRPQERWAPVLIAAPTLVERRLQAAFETSPGLRIAVDGDRASLAGEVAEEDEVRRRWLHAAWLGLEEVDDGSIDEGAKEIRQLIDQISRLVVPFPVAQLTPSEEDVVDEALSLLSRLDGVLEVPVRVEVVGRADPRGPPALNERLRTGRAAYVHKRLERASWSHLQFVEVSERPEREGDAAPSVVFRVDAP